MCSHFFSINCSTKDNEKLCKHFAEIALSFSCVLLSFLFLYSFIVSSVWMRACVCAWFECCSFVADSWNDTNCYHCAPLSLWKLTTTTEKFTIHEVQILDSQYSLKATWRGGEMTLMNDEYKTVLPPPKKTPNFNQCWRCLLSWTHALLLSFYHSNRKCTEYPVHTAGNGQRTQRARQLILRSNMREGKRLGEINNSPLL